MNTTSSTATWKEIVLPVLRSIELTTGGIELDRDQWPHWAADNPKFRRILAYSPHSASPLSSTLPSAGALAALLTERLDPRDYPKSYNYNYYLIAEATDGRLFQSRPKVPSDPSHHSSSPSTWFDNLGSPV